MKRITAILLLSLSLSGFAQKGNRIYEINVIPEPNHIEQKAGRYEYKGAPKIEFTTNPKLDKEQYIIDVKGNKVAISYSTNVGKQYALSTLEQMKQQDGCINFIPNALINDKPRFAYRGFMLDEARHFLGIEFVKKTLDWMAFHKLNKFHWHLTDDQGWRIEIKKYPLLTEKGAYRKGTQIGWKQNMFDCPTDSITYGGFYTQKQIKEVIAYAAERGIDIIPEIDMPGHMMAALHAYPQLGENKPYEVRKYWGVSDDVLDVSKPETMQFAKDVITEICDLFPYKIVHIGGDECPKVQWKKSESCQKLIKELNLKNEDELQAWFLNQIEKEINKKGKVMAGWDEIIEENMSKNAVVYHWRFWTKDNMTTVSARRGNQVVSTLNNRMYFDHYVSEDKDRFEPLAFPAVTPLHKIYNYNPVPAELEPEYHHKIIGIQGNLWTEYVTSPEVAQIRMFPRIAVLSEVAWTDQERRNWEHMNRKLPNIFKVYDSWKVRYNRVYIATGFDK